MSAMQINTKLIEEERERQGMGKCSFAYGIGLSVYGYGRLLKERSTSMKTLNRIADTLHLDPRDLLSND
jgi:hypothetical protein